MLNKYSPVSKDLLSFAIAILIALALGALVIMATGSNPLEAYSAALKSALGSNYRVLNTLCNTTVLIMTGLGCSVAFNAGIQNIGAEGQLYLGAFAAAIVGLAEGIPPVIHVILVLATAAGVGMLWALIPGVLRTRRGTDEVVVTLMMNYIAILLCSYFVNYPFRNRAVTWPETEMIQASAQLAYLHPLSRFNGTFFIALVCVAVIAFINRKTTVGYEWQMVGLNPRASAVAGIMPEHSMLTAMLVSGALAGLGGGMEVVPVMA
jgi:ABC-type uncharacterized transport system permease subunit